MSSTPRTDAVLRRIDERVVGVAGRFTCLAAYCRELERELIALQARVRNASDDADVVDGFASGAINFCREEE